MANPYYKNGIFTNTRANNRERKQRQIQHAIDNAPKNWGWTLVQSNDRGRVYEQGDLILVWVLSERAWLVGYHFNDQIEGRFYHGTVRQLTALLWALGLQVGPSDWH